jgi:hypothetical protein
MLQFMLELLIFENWSMGCMRMEFGQDELLFIIYLQLVSKPMT